MQSYAIHELVVASLVASSDWGDFTEELEEETRPPRGPLIAFIPREICAPRQDLNPQFYNPH